MLWLLREDIVMVWPALSQFLFVVLRQDLARLRLALNSNPAEREDGRGALPHPASLWLSGDFCCKHFGLCFFRFKTFVMENSCTSELCSMFPDDYSGIHRIRCGGHVREPAAVPVGIATCGQCHLCSAQGFGRCLGMCTLEQQAVI